METYMLICLIIAVAFLLIAVIYMASAMQKISNEISGLWKRISIDHNAQIDTNIAMMNNYEDLVKLLDSDFNATGERFNSVNKFIDGVIKKNEEAHDEMNADINSLEENIREIEERLGQYILVSDQKLDALKEFAYAVTDELKKGK